MPGEGEKVNGKLKMLPPGALTRRQAEFKFGPQDFRFTLGKNGALYAFCMTVPVSGTQLTIKSLGTDSKYLNRQVKSVTLLGNNGKLQWKQAADGLSITCPPDMPFATSVVFKID
jgi:alpha-L-fucosidase